MFEQVNGEGVNVIIVEECCTMYLHIFLWNCVDMCKDKDQATFDAHFKTPWFTALGKAIPEENLLAPSLDIKTVKVFREICLKIVTDL